MCVYKAFIKSKTFNGVSLFESFSQAGQNGTNGTSAHASVNQAAGSSSTNAQVSSEITRMNVHLGA